MPMASRRGPSSSWKQALREADVVVSCTAAPEVVISAAMVERALGRARVAPLLLLDLAVPRDIDRARQSYPACGCSMSTICARSARPTAPRAPPRSPSAEALVAGRGREVHGVVGGARGRADHPRAARARRVHPPAEIERTLAKLPDLSPHEQDAIGALSAAIVNKLLHQPIATLKDPDSGGQLARRCSSCFSLPRPRTENKGIAGSTEPD